MVSASFIQFVSQFGVILSGITAASLMIRLRFRAVKERQQTKWFVYASVWLVFFIVISVLTFLSIDPNAPYPLGAFLGINA
jgi:uncharacterized membrane protein YozB (DUF420 family)